MKLGRGQWISLGIAGPLLLLLLLYVSPLGPALSPLTLYSDSIGPGGYRVLVYLLPNPSMDMPRRNDSLSSRDVLAELRDAHGWLRRISNPWDAEQASSAELVRFEWADDHVTWAAARRFPLSPWQSPR